MSDHPYRNEMVRLLLSYFWCAIKVSIFVHQMSHNRKKEVQIMLTNEQAKENLKKYGPNELEEGKKKASFKYF